MEAELKAGTVLDDQYEIVRPLGQGAMGTVYLGLDQRVGNRECAIKVLRVSAEASLSALADSLKRLQSEAHVLGRLSAHPNIVTVYTARQDDNGLPFVAMEYVEGETLRDKLARGTPLDDQAVRIVRQVAAGLAHAHAVDIVHRDLKPSNLIVTRPADGPPCVKIVDFGIAKIVRRAGAPNAEPELTASGEIVGTERYMSPEQSSATRHVDTRSDIYSLALIATELIVTDRYETLDMQPGRPGIDSLTDSREWPEVLKATLAKGLAWEPDDRFQSALEFSEAYAAAVSQWKRGPVAAKSRIRWTAAAAIVVLSGAGYALSRSALPEGALVIAPAVTDAGSLGDVPEETSEPNDDGGPDNPIEEAARSGAGTGSGNREAAREATVDAPPEPQVSDHALALEMLRTQVDLDAPRPEALRQAVEESTRVLAAGDIDPRVGYDLRYLRGEALMLLGDSPEACEDFRAIERARTTSPWVDTVYGAAVGAILELQCSRGPRGGDGHGPS